ncbi:DUF6476 family protein [Aurantimonas sp. 22II-16-19i]|uniref:DUF6476 family protein n=1 Tax=Aurantimonas sp. 22II-16-19i TaxID=1317114 RepID=UPI0009F7EACF|nr:DUF6476 family protein [Aurantimonas sp. 22II-16-19i]ORE98844.1 hypothetical protein ATO4_00720 [Aurantimonas sp. 22II-16-19i]
MYERLKSIGLGGGSAAAPDMAITRGRIMARGNQDEPEDEMPLDPAAERLRRKMVRLLVVSVGIMIVGVMAVLGVVVYKTLPRDGGLGEAAATIAIPAGEAILAVSMDGERALVHTRADGADRLYVVSLADGAVLKRLAVGQGAAGN